MTALQYNENREGNDIVFKETVRLVLGLGTETGYGSSQLDMILILAVEDAAAAMRFALLQNNGMRITWKVTFILGTDHSA